MGLSRSFRQRVTCHFSLFLRLAVSLFIRSFVRLVLFDLSCTIRMHNLPYAALDIPLAH